MQPDPTRPTIENGGFESVAGDPPAADRLALSAAIESGPRQRRPGGRTLRHVQQHHARPPQPCPARFRRRRPKGGAVADFGAAFAAATFDRGRPPSKWPAIIISFYDENRTPVGETVFDTWRGTFDWQSETRSINVPLRPARASAHRLARCRRRDFVRRDQVERGEEVTATGGFARHPRGKCRACARRLNGVNYALVHRNGSLATS